MSMTLCEEAYEVNANPFILIVWAWVIICNTPGIVYTLHVCKLIASSQVEIFHIDLRIIFVNLSLGLIFRSLGTSVRAVQQLFLAATWSDKCDFVQDAYYCMVQAKVNLTPFNTCVYSYLAVALERSYATLNYRTYEKKRYRAVSFLVSAATWIHPVIDLVNTVRRDVPEPRERSYCSAVTAQPINLSQVFNNQIILCCISLVIFVALYVYCLKKKRMTINTQEHSLTGRFQLVENIRASRIILPNAIIFGVITLLNILFLYLLEISKKHHGLAAFAVFKELMSLTVPVYINIYAWIFILRCPQFAQRTWIVRRFKRFTKKTMPEEPESPSEHFKMLKSFWC